MPTPCMRIVSAVYLYGCVCVGMCMCVGVGECELV